MVLAVKIQNRETGEFYCKGGGFGKKGKAWATLGYAKLAICPHGYYFYGINSEELNSDFIIINDNGTIEKMPVALYFMDYFTREQKHSFNREKIQNIIEQIKQYCKDNNIELENSVNE